MLFLTKTRFCWPAARKINKLFIWIIFSKVLPYFMHFWNENKIAKYCPHPHTSVPKEMKTSSVLIHGTLRYFKISTSVEKWRNLCIFFCLIYWFHWRHYETKHTFYIFLYNHVPFYIVWNPRRSCKLQRIIKGLVTSTL